MNTIITIARKDLRLMSRDKMGMFFIIGFPIAMGLFFGAMVSGIGSSKDTEIDIACVDEDQSAMSKKFIDAIKSNDNLKVVELDREEAINRVRRGNLVGLIAVPKGYGETAGVFWEQGPALQVGVDPSRTAEAGMLQGLVMQAVGELTMSRFQNTDELKPMLENAKKSIVQDPDTPAVIKPILTTLMGQLDTLSDQLDQLEAAQEAEPGGGGNGGGNAFEFANVEQIDIARQTNSISKKLRSRWDISFPQAMLWGVLGCCAGFAITMVRERTQGTMLRLQVAPLGRYQILAGKALACFVAVVGVIVTLVVLGVALGMQPNSYLNLTIAAFCVAVCFVGVMMLMSVIGKSEEAVGGAAWGANIAMSMFGGGMVPLAFMPGVLRTISNFSPVKWGIVALEGAVWRDFSLAEMATPCAVLVGIGAVSMSIGVLVLTRSEK